MDNSTGSTSEQTLSQKELFKKKLLEIKKDVTKEDRTLCAESLTLSKTTIDRYVNGHVYDNDTAFKVYTFLQGRIEKRASALK